jgi:hypothetical protein
MEGIALEARQMGIEQGFGFAAQSDKEARAIFENIGAMRSNDLEILYGLQF